MKKLKVFTVILCITVCVLTLVACGKGGKVKSTVGSSFKLPIVGTDDQVYSLKVSSFEVSKKEADSDNIDDYNYVKATDCYYFTKFIYNIKLEGEIDKVFAGETLEIRFSFEAANGEIVDWMKKIDVDENGKFNFDEKYYSNMNLISITPGYVQMEIVY